MCAGGTGAVTMGAFGPRSAPGAPSHSERSNTLRDWPKYGQRTSLPSADKEGTRMRAYSDGATSWPGRPPSVLLALAAGVLATAAMGGCLRPGDAGTVEIRAADLVGGSPSLQVQRAGRYRVRLVNDGVDELHLRFADGSTLAAHAGDTRWRRLSVPAGGLVFRRVDAGAASWQGRIAVSPPRLASRAAAAPVRRRGPRPPAPAAPRPDRPPPARRHPSAPPPPPP